MSDTESHPPSKVGIKYPQGGYDTVGSQPPPAQEAVDALRLAASEAASAIEDACKYGCEIYKPYGRHGPNCIGLEAKNIRAALARLDAGMPQGE